MSLSAIQIEALVTLGAPVLCVDTCAVLDILRDVTRETARAADAQAALALLRQAEARPSGLIVLMAEQVQRELSDNLDAVEAEAQGKLSKFRAAVHRIHDIAQTFGASGSIDTSHWTDHVDRARKTLDRWVAVSWQVPQSPDTAGRALARVNEPRIPARKGKDSMKDCVVVEAYLEVAHQLRAGGLTAPVAFVSSNTKEYHVPTTGRLEQQIAQDFAAFGIEFAPSFGAAKHSLRL